MLAILLENAGEVVSREELQKQLWPADTFVDFDHGLNKAINKIRDALGDSADSPRFVETVARRGYRFLAEVKVANGSAAHAVGSVNQSLTETAIPSLPDLAGRPAMPKRFPPSRAGKISSLVALALVMVLVLLWLHFRNRSSSGIRSLAVLPLESLSGDANQDYFADGMTDELITDLGRIAHCA